MRPNMRERWIKMWKKGLLDQCLIWIVSFSPHQMLVNSLWTQTQHTDTSLCLRTRQRWLWWERSSLILIIQKDSSTGSSCCVQTVWRAAVTGRWWGKAGCLWEWLTGESEGERLTAASGSVTGLGVCAALISVTLPLPVTEWQPYTLPSLFLREWQCIWTGLLAFCPSTQSPLTGWPTCTPSNPHSLNLSTLRLGLSMWLGLTPLCLCVRWKRKRKTHTSAETRHYKITHLTNVRFEVWILAFGLSCKTFSTSLTFFSKRFVHKKYSRLDWTNSLKCANLL